MRTAAITICASVLLLGGARATSAGSSSNQEPARVIQELRLKDGSRLYGYVDESTSERVVMTTITGTQMEVQRVQIDSLEPARGRLVDGEFLPADPNPTRLFFAPTGRALRRGTTALGASVGFNVLREFFPRKHSKHEAPKP